MCSGAARWGAIFIELAWWFGGLVIVCRYYYLTPSSLLDIPARFRWLIAATDRLLAEDTRTIRGWLRFLKASVDGDAAFGRTAPDALDPGTGNDTQPADSAASILGAVHANLFCRYLPEAERDDATDKAKQSARDRKAEKASVAQAEKGMFHSSCVRGVLVWCVAPNLISIPFVFADRSRRDAAKGSRGQKSQKSRAPKTVGVACHDVP